MNTSLRLSNLGIGYPQVSKDKIARVAIAFALLFAFASSGFAQAGRVTRYTVTTTGIPAFSTISGSTSFGSGDDSPYQCPQSLPFQFYFDSTLFAAGTTINVNTNGGMSFANNQSGCCSDYLNNTSYFNYIFPFDYDMYTTGGLYYSVTGSSPNRVFTIEWGLIRAYSGNNNTTNYQVRLYETTHVIEFAYKDHSYALWASGNEAGIGLNGGTTYGFKYVSYATGQASTPSVDIRWTPPSNAPPAQLSLTPKTTVNFGTYAVGQSNTVCTITAQDVGTANLHILGAALSSNTPPDYTVISGPVAGDSILAGQSKSWCIKFAPITNGTRSGTFGVTTDGRDSAVQFVNLTGIGIAPAVSYSATTMFHNTTVKLRDSSAIQYLTVNSTGTGPLSFQSIYFTGLNADNYRVVRMPQNPLPFGQTDSIGIRFIPNIEGRPDASLIIATNAINIPYDTVTLFGVGSLPHLAIGVPPPSMGNLLSFDSVALGDSVCQTVVLSNPGTDTLNLRKQLITYGDYDFSFYPLTGTDTMILSGQSKLVNVCFKPLKNGFREASIRFATNIQKTFDSPPKDTSQFVVYVAGIGVPYGHLVVIGPLADTAAVGKSNCIIDTFKNVGVADLTVSNASIVGPNSSSFTMVSGAPFTLAPGQKMPVTICYNAAASGENVDTLRINGTTSEHPFTENLNFTGYGAQICASAAPMTLTFGGLTLTNTTARDTVTITNCGDFASTYSGVITPSGTTYSLQSASIGPVAPQGTGQFVVSFLPTTIGPVTGNLSISGTEGPVTNIQIALNGVGAGVTATASGSPADAVSMGACANFDITITNNGNYPWTPGAGTIGGANAADFTIVSGPTPAVIPPNATATVTVKFCPTMIGSENMSLTFPSASPMPEQAFSYSTSGIGAASGVSLKSSQDGFVLGQSYPNPTNGVADVSFTLPRESQIAITVQDLTGATVQSVFTGPMGSGDHTMQMNAKDLPSGTYFYTLTSGDVRLTRQMTIVR